MLINLLVFLCGISPTLRRLLWKWWYGKLARKVGMDRWTFMNYGFKPATNSLPLVLEEADESDRYCAQLYHHVASATSLQGKDVLEVGSGRGGGCSFLARYHVPKQITGADFSADAVKFCQRRHADVSNLTFLPGDAENLPFPDASFDVVINVESSHCYGNETKFFSEVARVLRPGGHFLFADLREAADAAKTEANLAKQPWKQFEREVITQNVISALEADDQRKRTLINEFVPRPMQKVFEEFAGLTGHKVFENFRNGTLTYLRFAMVRD